MKNETKQQEQKIEFEFDSKQSVELVNMINVLIKGCELGQSKGSFTLAASSQIHQAIDAIKRLLSNTADE